MMKTVFNGQCLCGDVKFESTSGASFQANCHCDDCRRSGGGVYSSFVFIPLNALNIVEGTTQSFQHSSDSGSQMTKHFCGECGSQLFTENSNFPDRRGIRVGAIDDASWFKPMANVYTCHKLNSTPLDPSVKAFDKMPN